MQFLDFSNTAVSLLFPFIREEIYVEMCSHPMKYSSQMLSKDE